MEACETNVMLDEGTIGANIGRMMMGSTVGIEALGSPWEVLDIRLTKEERILKHKLCLREPN